MTRAAGWRDRAAGVLLATAAGDALGAGYEFTYPDDAAIGMIGGGSFDWAPGEWTDDTVDGPRHRPRSPPPAPTSRTRAQAWTPSPPASREWYDSRPQGHRQPDPRGALRPRHHRRRDDRPPPGAIDRPQGRQRIADAHRRRSASPTWTTPTPASRPPPQVGALTHDDQRAIQACQLWSSRDPARGAARHLRRCPRLPRRRPADRRRTGARCSTRPRPARPEDFAEQRLGGARAADGVVGDHPRRPADDARHLADALELAVRAGGDTDTTAAIAGALLGARWGASAVPAALAPDAARLARAWTPATWSGWPRSTANRGRDDQQGWPSVDRVDYAELGHRSRPGPAPARRRRLARRLRRRLHRSGTTR